MSVFASVLIVLAVAGQIEPRSIASAVVRNDAAALETIRRQIQDELAESEEPSADRGDYTLAYVNWRLANLYPTQGEGIDKQTKKANKTIREPLLKEAEAVLKALVERDPEDAESHALLGTVYGARISSMWSGMRLGPRADKSLKRALELAPDNPRVAFQLGVGAFFKPGMFGGGDDKAQAELERALELFAQQPPGAPWPHWGHVDAWIWLGQVHAKRKEWAQARTAYERALELEPDHVFVRDELLPQLDRQSSSE